MASNQQEAVSETQQLTVPESQVTVAEASGNAAKRKRGRPTKTAAVSGGEGQSAAPTAGSSTSASKGGDGQSASAAKRQSAAAAKLERDMDAHLAKHKAAIIADAVSATQRSWTDQYRDAMDLLKAIRLEHTDADVEHDDLEPSADGHVHFRIFSVTWSAMREAVVEREIMRNKTNEMGQQLADHRKAISELTEAVKDLQRQKTGVGIVEAANPTISTGVGLVLDGAGSGSQISTSSPLTVPSFISQAGLVVKEKEKRVRKQADLNQNFLDDFRSLLGIHRNDPLPDYPSDEEHWPRHKNGEKMLRFRWTEETNDEKVSEFLGSLADKYTRDENAKARYGASGLNREQVMRILKDQFRSKKKTYRRQKRRSETQQSAQGSKARTRARRDTRIVQITPILKEYGLLGNGWHAAMKAPVTLPEVTTDEDSDSDSGGEGRARARGGSRGQRSGRPVQQVLPAWASWELYQLWTLTFEKVDKRGHSTRVIKPKFRTVWDKPLPEGTQPWMVDGWWKEQVMADAALRSNSGPFDGTGPARSSSEFGTSVRLPVRAADGSELPPNEDRLHNGAGADGELGPRYGPEASSCEPLKMGLDAWLADTRNPCHPAHLAVDSGYHGDSESDRRHQDAEDAQHSDLFDGGDNIDPTLRDGDDADPFRDLFDE